jgi:hypothetical protein
MGKEEKTIIEIHWGVIFLMVGMICVTVLVNSLITTKVSVDADCSVDEITLTNVTPNKCWASDISPNFCPIPKGIHCKISGSVPAIMIGSING